MNRESVLRTAPWRSLAYFIVVTFGSVMGPMFIVGESLDYLPEALQTVTMGFAFGIVSTLLGVMLYFIVWEWFDVSDHFMKWDNWTETLNYPLRGDSE